MDIIALAILGILFGIQLVIPKARLNKSGLFGISALIISAVFIFGRAGYLSWQQYISWKSGGLTKFFLPPYRDLSYFVFYARSQFFNSYLLSLFFAILFLWPAKYFNKKYEERFFEPIEPYFLAIAIFLDGHPAWIFYLILLFAVVLITQIFNAIRYPLNVKRLSLYYLWLPTAIFTILISRWLSVLPWWQTLKF